jgi:hypothetical protein
MNNIYRKVAELNDDELNELREYHYYSLEEIDKDVFDSYSCPEEIPMEEIKTHYEGTSFVTEDFWCNI